jgi:hypothetical protein
METKSKFINELTQRVYDKIFEEKLNRTLIDFLPPLETCELANIIDVYLDDFISPKEQDDLISDDFDGIECEDAKSLIIRAGIELAAINLHMALDKVLTDKDFVGDNPYSVFENPRMFMLYKYYNEQMGIKLNPDSLGEINGIQSERT